ncbi:MAG: GNAT family N-acetyltransferase [Candidatus Pacebacteria bacterium]|nr:GNAT family N-acetyltransferase [Candidatus Paceibacterota bacterium]
MKIRTTTLADAQAIFNIQKKTWLNTYPNEKYGVYAKDIAEKFADEERVISKIGRWLSSDNQDHQGWVAKDGDKVIGFARTYRKEDKIMLGAIYVLSEYQRQGLGKKLLEKVLEFQDRKKDKIEAIWLEVAIYNNKAINFYKKAGFELIKGSEGKFKVGEGKFIPTIKMKLII